MKRDEKDPAKDVAAGEVAKKGEEVDASDIPTLTDNEAVEIIN